MRREAFTLQEKKHIAIISINISMLNLVELARQSNEFVDLCARVGWDNEARVVIVNSGGKNVFSEKTDLIVLAPQKNKEPWARFGSLAEPIAKLDKPVIAAITVDAIGQGLELALACDIRIASETSHFGLPQIKYGLIPEDGGTQRLSRLVGNSKALEMILTGEMIDAQEAFRIGLVNKVVSPDKVMTVVVDMANEMASKGTIAVRYAKEAIYKGMDMTLEQGLRLEADLYLLIHTTRDRVEGIKAFREKRPPKFEGK
jgi:enoyl-CoA hydratase